MTMRAFSLSFRSPHLFLTLNSPTVRLIHEHILPNRYDPLEIELNNRQYMSNGEVPASSDARKLAWSLSEVGEDKGSAGQNALPRAAL